MPYYNDEKLKVIRKVDLKTYLEQTQMYTIKKLKNDVYTTLEHDSLYFDDEKWIRFSVEKGGYSALDYLNKVLGIAFLDCCAELEKMTYLVKDKPDYVVPKEYDGKFRALMLPLKSESSARLKSYLYKRCIDSEIVNYCLDNNLIYEDLNHHNVVFVGYDENNEAKFACYRSTGDIRCLGDCLGSSKKYSFRILNKESNELHIFESAIDLMSYATIRICINKPWKDINLLSLSGVYGADKSNKDFKIPDSIKIFLENNTQITTIYLHLDNDETGRNSTKALSKALRKDYLVIDSPPPEFKDFNDFLRFARSFDKVDKSKERSDGYER